VSDGTRPLGRYGLVVETFVGSAHCDETNVIFLWLAWPVGTVAHSYRAMHYFVRDPNGVVPRTEPMGWFSPETTLPGDARDTGYRRGSYHLFVSSLGDAVFLQNGSHVERWPRLRQPLLCE